MYDSAYKKKVYHKHYHSPKPGTKSDWNIYSGVDSVY